MRWSQTSRLFLALSLLALPLVGKSQWIAFNDHAAGTGTAANATRWNVFGTTGGAPGNAGFLKNIVNGTNLPVTLTITTNVGAGTAPANTQAAPATGTPAYNVFNGFVDFQGTPNPSVELTNFGIVTYTFTGLDPAKRYNFKGSAIRGGNADYTNRWTLVEIQSAQTFTAAHTPNVLTSNQFPAAIGPTQAAFNSGLNNAASQGDYVSWDNIQPSAGGVITITSKQYTNSIPGGFAVGSKGYGLTGVRLEELSAGATPIQIISQPQDVTVNAPNAATMSVSVSGTSPNFQWYKVSTGLLSGKTNSSLTFNPSALSDNGDYYVIVTNSLNSVTSRIAKLTVVFPPTIYTNIGLTNTQWKYYQAGDEPAASGGLTWKDAGYNDTSWSSGRGILALETDNAYVLARTNTVLSLTNAGGTRISAYYFRNQFVLTNDPSAVSVVMSNIVDDGAVVYLNGTEVWRFNLPSGTIGYGSLANGASPEGVFNWTNLPTSLLRATNTIAVEVHQVNLTSSDIVFGMEVKTIVPPPSQLVIVSQPQSVVVEERKDAVFTVGLQGGDPHNQWYKDGVAISNATQTTLSLQSVTFADAGTYVFVSTNIVNAVTSAPVTLTVTADTNRPVLLLADGTANLTNVLVYFNERVSPATATNTANYKITNTVGGATLSITRATLQPNGTNVLLTTAARTTGANYILVVNNVTDLATTPNTIVPNSSTPIIQAITFFGLNSVATYYNPYQIVAGNGDPTEIGTTWVMPNYDEAGSGVAWADGNGLFYFGTETDSLPGTVMTALSQTAAYVDFYRVKFDAQNASPSGLTLTLNHVVDDGAIFYLNGQEVYRFNMPSGPLASNDSPANVTVGNASLVSVSIPGSLMVTGQNVLAVSVHQANRVDIDRTFGASLSGRVQSFTVGPVFITGGPEDVTVEEGKTATFSAVAVGASRFQWQSNGVPIASATNGTYTTVPVTTNMNGSLFRLAASNGTAGVLSTNATLRVIADTNAPTIVSAYIGSNGSTIVVSFSENLNPTSAQALANYLVTNASGANPTLTGATLSNGTNVILSFNAALSGRYAVVVNNVTDSSSSANKIAANSTVFVGADYNIAMTSAWKYLLINTNEQVQESYYEVAYDDSSWSGPSNALHYVETAGLPFPKNTPLSLTDSGGGYINTFYFRQRFYAGIGSTNITMRLRHVIDDGLVLYLNGREIYRYNMGTGPVTASTQAPANVGDATVLGPFDVVITNLVGGTNILAAEVHQNGANSSDVVFGVELIGSIPSVVVTNRPAVILAQPQSRTNAVGTTASFSVTADGSPTLYYQWRSNNVAIAGATNSTLNVTNVQLSDNGKQFSVIVSNYINSVTSTVATLTVTNVPPLCTPVSWTNQFKLSVSVTNGTNIALSWSNPVTNSCSSNATVVLQRAIALGTPTLWTNVYTNVSGAARVVVTNGASPNGGNHRFYQIKTVP